MVKLFREVFVHPYNVTIKRFYHAKRKTVVSYHVGRFVTSVNSIKPKIRVGWLTHRLITV